jgi:hypothetical protein
MARTSAISLLKTAGVKADLAEIYGIVIDNVQKDTLASTLKSQAYTGNPNAGSVVFKRFVNSQSKTYGTARAARAGDAITIPDTVCNLDQHKEIVEECAKFDLDTFGVGSIMARRAVNHIDSMVATLESAFFDAAGTAATATNTAETDALKRLEALILDLETVSNDYVRGVPRSMINVICSPAYYSSVRDSLDSKPVPNVNTAAEEFGTYRGVRVYSSIYVPTGIDAIAVATGAVAQPVISDQYGEPEKIPLSNDYASSLFYSYGVKVLTPDLIFKLETTPSTLGELDVTSAAGADTNGSVITIDPSSAGSGNSFVYKLGAAYTPFDYDDTLTAGWTAIASGDDIACSTNTKITVAKIVTATGKARSRGIAVLVKKS